jgi:hypothetical protein
MDLTWILFKRAGSEKMNRVTVSQNGWIRSLDDCNKALEKWFSGVISVGFYPVSEAEFEELPDNQVFLHV